MFLKPLTLDGKSDMTQKIVNIQYCHQRVKLKSELRMWLGKDTVISKI